MKEYFYSKRNEFFRVNNEINASEVRIVGKIKTGVYKLDLALKISREQGLDLVEIYSSTIPPVCKIIDYSKFKYDRKKKNKIIKSRSNKITVKEIRFGPNIDDHDLNFKLNHAIKFLKSGSKLRVYVQFKGRSIIFKERGEFILLKFARLLEKYGKLDQYPKLDGKKIILTLSPLK